MLKDVLVIITDRPSKVAIINKIVKILNSLTGIQWGYVDIANSTKYITSEFVPIKIGLYDDKKIKNDIVVGNKNPRLFTTDEMFVTALSVELQTKLLDSELLTQRRFAKLVGKLISYMPIGEYAENIIESKRQWEKYPQLTAEKIDRLDIKNKWLDDCLVV